VVTAAVQPSIEQVWAWLADVPDPEVPVVSVVDLGIVRDVAWDGDTLEVTVTPTYSGCPATAAISLDIQATLRGHGVARFRVTQRLAPAWTTDWIGPAAREKLRAYGIAPPAGAACAGALAPVAVACPRCGMMATERVSQFGSTPCKAAYRCTACLEPFDYFKAH
jgi:ring-1,2-phenylacetyl-CoA epoxidase subunit PaaD